MAEERRPSVDECRKALASAPVSRLPRLIRSFKDDPRAGVLAAVGAASKRLAKHRAEDRRLAGLMTHQMLLHEQGIEVVAGCDEVGVGCLAGPVTAGAVVLGPDTRIRGLDDSKRLTPEMRTRLAEEVRSEARAWSVAHVSVEDIDSIGIWAAITEAMKRALAALSIPPEHVLIDGLRRDVGLPATAIVKGDHSVAAIAAASVVAKVERDALMTRLHDEYPEYCWAENKGYSTSDHLNAIDRFGPCPYHRRSYARIGQPQLPFDDVD